MKDQAGSSAAYFDERYRRNPDPWNFAASAYEQLRFEIVLRALSHRRYRHALEPACSIGTLTERLAGICDAVTACDYSEVATGLAIARCRHLPNVSVQCAALCRETAFTGFDLVILSEVGYYFGPRDWEEIVHALAAQIEDGAEVLACHWLGTSEEHLQSGDGVHAALRAAPYLRLQHEERHEMFRLDRFCRKASSAVKA